MFPFFAGRGCPRPDRADLADVRDVVERVCVEHDEVGPLVRLERPDLRVELHARRGVAGRRSERLLRRQAGLDHHLQLHQLEIALESCRRAGVGSHCDRHPGVGQFLEIAIRDLEAGLVPLRRLAVGHRLLALRLLERVHRRHVGMREKQRIAEPRRRRRVGEGRDLAHQCRAVADVPPLHHRDERVIDRDVANAVGDEVRTRVQHRLGIVEIKEVHGDAQPFLVRLVDDRLVDLRRHLRRRAEVVVDADLDDVHLHRRIFVHERDRVGGGYWFEHRSGDEQPRAIERRRPLRISCGDARCLIVAE